MSRAADRGEVKHGQLIRGPRYRTAPPAHRKVDGGISKTAEADLVTESGARTCWCAPPSASAESRQRAMKYSGPEHVARASEATGEAHSGSSSPRKVLEDVEDGTDFMSVRYSPKSEPVLVSPPSPRVPPLRDRALPVCGLPPAAAAPLASDARMRPWNQHRRQYFLELYVGCARMTACMAELGARIMTPCELENGAHFDFSNRHIQKVILSRIASGSIWALHLGTPCARWSRARTSGRHEPVGGLDAALFTLRVVDECRKAGVIFTIENPKALRLWDWPPLAKRLRRAGALYIDFPQCAFGTPYQKFTRLASSTRL